MSVLVIGDPHFKPKYVSCMDLMVKEIMALVETEKPSLVVCLGDVLDTHERINLLARCQALKFFMAISELCETVVLVGNHDRINNSDYMSPDHPFTGVQTESLRFVSKTEWDKERNFIYVPYVPNGRFKDALDVVGYTPGDEKEPALIFAHQEFEGAQMGAVVSKHGDKWSEAFPTVISGHIHGYQNLPGVIYPGTPIQHKYGDSTDKALMLISKPKPLEFKRVVLKTVPRRKIIHLDYEKLVAMTASELLEVNDNDFLCKVVVRVHQSQTKMLKKLPAYLTLKKTCDRVEIKVVASDKATSLNILSKDLTTSDHMQMFRETVVECLNGHEQSLRLFESLMNSC